MLAPRQSSSFFTKHHTITRQLGWVILLCLFSQLGCTPELEPIVSPTATLPPSPTAINLPEAEPLPAFLQEVRPAPGAFLTLADFITVRSVNPTEFVFEGPPAPPVAEVGYRSSICLLIDTQPVAQPGLNLFFEDEVLPDVDIRLNDQPLTERAETGYLAVLELPAGCTCFFDCSNDPNTLFRYEREPQPNVGCYSTIGVWVCYLADASPGLQNVDVAFGQTLGIDATYSWSFALTE